jgi:hypothetical protein
MNSGLHYNAPIILLYFIVPYYISIHFVLSLQLHKVKQSRNRPSVAQRVPGGLGSHISWHSACEDDAVVSLTHRPPLPPAMFLVLIFTRGWVDPRAMERSEGDMSLKNPVTPAEIDPGTVRLVAQRLNHYATPGPLYNYIPQDNLMWSNTAVLLKIKSYGMSRCPNW